jgi:uncharacterized membrane protein YGL010W
VTDFFRRQLAIYADHHRDPRNITAHHVGIPAIFLAVLLPLSLWHFPVGVWQPSLAAALLVPAVIGWIALDAGVGIAMLVMIVPLLVTAELVAGFGGALVAWPLSAMLLAIGLALLAIGHAVFERRRPALAGNAFQIFIGPMFMIAKVLVALGWRPDLAAPLQAPAVERVRSPQ